MDSAARQPKPTTQLTRVLRLVDGENFETSLFRLRKGEKLKFILDTSLQPYKLELLCNHPAQHGDKFDRKKYRELSWTAPFQCNADDGDRYASIDIFWPGTFHFKLLKDSQVCCQGSFVVEPTLRVGADTALPLDSIVMQTVLTKSLGHFEDWEKRLEVAKECGYNMIHFTPLQELGESQSSYSLKHQLVLNPSFSSGKRQASFNDVKALVKKMQSKWNVLSLTDIVWNHTANNTEWIREHPEAAYNLENSPHLRPAFVLDRALWYFNKEISQGKWNSEGLPTFIATERHLERIAHIYWNFIVKSMKLEEFYMIDVEDIVKLFKKSVAAEESESEHLTDESEMSDIKIMQNPLYKRFKNTVCIKTVLSAFHAKRRHSHNPEGFLHEFCSQLKEHLLKLNEKKKHQMVRNHEVIIFNIIAGIKYRYLEEHGPKHSSVTEHTPIITRYFCMPERDSTLENDCKLMDTSKANLIFAHQGWVMNGDALKDFAAPESEVYLKRQLIAWGDSIKLRYGESEKDCPFLWNHMKEYTQMMARIFHGIRLDNCHGTPIAVAQYLLDAARDVNPDLYVMAELFTNSEAVDNTFINRLGISSLIRERMSAGNARDLGRLVHRYGGEPVGSFFHPTSSPLTSSMAHALFMDLTHDNRSPAEVHSIFDFLPGSALVAASCCAIGSNRGYDELVPHHISVVEEARLYKSWKKNAKPGEDCVSLEAGIMKAKHAMNKFHVELCTKGYDQVYVDQVDENIVSVTRHCPATHKSVIVVAHTAFNKTSPLTDSIPPLVIPGIFEEIVFEAIMLEDLKSKPFKKNNKFINGLENYKVKMQENINIADSMVCRLTESTNQESGHMTEVIFENFPPGSVVILKVSLKSKTTRAIQNLRSALRMFPEQGYPFEDDGAHEISPVQPIIDRLTLAGLNRILYRCSSEELDDGHRLDVYHIPNYGSLTYCGLQGFVSVLSLMRSSNDLGHPMAENLRAGDWMPDYIYSRLKHNHLTRLLGLWLESVFSYLRELPRFLIPCYFDAIITSVYVRLIEFACSRMSPFVRNGSTFIKYLALVSVQLCGLTNSAPLPKLSSNIGNINEAVTMSAGLPHFSTGMWRCWGRDTFIAARGMLLLTGRFSVARNLILAFGGCTRHGLIANLLNKGSSARYNCRDAVWWWLQVIKEYCLLAPSGYDILNQPVVRMYPRDESPPEIANASEQPLYEIIQEVLQKHVDGISFRERNAGPGLDSNMKDDGFNMTAGIDPKTGFPFGGNKWNCGTWMDKVGGSHTSGNWGHPATPRDGSAVEIVGLCKSIVSFLAQIHGEGKYPYSGVNTNGDELTFYAWANLIQSSFEREFWIDENPNEEESEAKLVHKRGIYKDCLKATHRYTDYQLRPNFPIAMSVAPELFEPQHAMKALKMVEESLSGPLGLATLDPRDWAYDGFYENDTDSTNFQKALGFNYHQGPEWTWIYGPFLRAKLHFARLTGGKVGLRKAITEVKVVLARHKEEILTSPWRGLPELSNKGGGFCAHSCQTQAWSMACVLEVLYDLKQLVPSSE
eukprot:gene8072-8936_t